MVIFLIFYYEKYGYNVSPYMLSYDPNYGSISLNAVEISPFILRLGLGTIP